MDKIKVTFFLQNLEVGGAERSLVRLANAINKKYFEVSFLLCSVRGALLQNLSKEIKVVDLKSPHASRSLIKVVKYLHKEKPDIILSALEHINLISIAASFFCRKKPKVIITERSTLSRLHKYAAHKTSHILVARFIMPYLAKIFYKKADLIICVSKGVADDISKIIGDLPSIKVIYNPVTDDSILKLVTEPITDFNISKEGLPIIIAVGRLTKAKDYSTMLKAVSIVLKDMPVRLLIVGDGEEREKIENFIKENGISDSVHLLGFQKNPLKYMAKADIFVLSSVIEGFPNVLVEAMACGVPVISTDCQSGPSEIIENGKNGLLVPVGDENLLAQAIVKLLKNLELRSEFSKEGKKRAQYFSIEKSVKEFEDIFKKMSEK